MRISQIQLFGQVWKNFLSLTLYSRIISSVLKAYDSSHFPFHWCLIRAWSIVPNEKKIWIRNLHNIKCFINPVEWKLRRPSIFMGSFSSLFFYRKWTENHFIRFHHVWHFSPCSSSFKFCRLSMLVPLSSFVNWCIFAWINARCHSEKKEIEKEVIAGT